MLGVTLPLRAAGSLWLSGYLYLNGEPCLGWLMNDSVFITMAVSQSHHRDFHILPQVSERLCRIPGSTSGEFRGTPWSQPSLMTMVVSELHTQRCCVWLSESPQASSLHLRVCEDWEFCTKATVGWYIQGDRGGKSAVNVNTSLHRSNSENRGKCRKKETRTAFVGAKKSF